jgi:general secretion pathway protein G
MPNGRREGRKGRRQRGFTLIELLVVCAIIGILSAVAVANYRRSIVKAKEAVLQQDLYTMRTLINQYFADKGKYPSDLQALVEDHYLQTIPKDPFTENAESWATEPAEMDESDITTEPGIANVRSGAEGTSLDGRSYSDF